MPLLSEARPGPQRYPYWRVLALAAVVGWLAVVGAIVVVEHVARWLA